MSHIHAFYFMIRKYGIKNQWVNTDGINRD